MRHVVRLDLVFLRDVRIDSTDVEQALCIHATEVTDDILSTIQPTGAKRRRGSTEWQVGIAIGTPSAATPASACAKLTLSVAVSVGIPDLHHAPVTGRVQGRCRG